MKTLKTLLLILAISACAFAQNVTTSTTLSVAITGTSNGTLSLAGSPLQTVCLTSSTGVVAPGFNGGFAGTNQTELMVDREAMFVQAATPSANCWSVQRGWDGTQPAAHASGATVWVGPASSAQGSPFQFHPPPGGVGTPCLSTATPYNYMPIVILGADQYSTEVGEVWNCPTSGAGVNTWEITSTPQMTSPILTDWEIFVPAGSFCSASTTGTAGAGNDTVILDGSVPALKASATGAGASNNSFDCNLTAALRTTIGKGITLNSITSVYSVQTTTATSMPTPTIKLFNAPASGTSETASSATLVTTTGLVGGTLTMTPAVASANLTAVSAGQYYTELISLGTPITMNSDLRTYVLHFEVDQSASAAQIVTVPGMWLRGTQIPF